MNTKAMIPLIAGLGIAGVAGKLGYDYVKKAQGAQTQRIQLWAVMEDIPRGRAIGESDLKPLAFPADLAPAGALGDKSKILGRVPHTGVPSGVPVLETMLLPPGTPPGIHVPPGLRAVAVKIDESSGVDNHLQPGCRVDVVGYFTVKTQNNRNETIARTIVENVEVAAVGQRLAPDTPERPSKDAAAKKTAAPTRDKPARAATLLVTPEQVPVILLAEHRGEIKLSMRGLEDSAKLDRYETVREGEVTGTGDPQAKTDTAAGAKSANGLAGLVSGLFGSLQKGAGADTAESSATASGATPPHAEPVAEAEPVKPEYEAMMVIVNGNERRTVGWVKDAPLQPVDISPDGPNLFEKPAAKRGKSKGDSKAEPKTGPQTEQPGKTDSPDAKTKQPPKTETKPQPTGPEEETEIIPVTEEETDQPKELIG